MSEYDDVVECKCLIFCVFQFKPEEITNIMKDFDEPGFLAPTGLFLGGTKYMVIQGEPGAVIRGKKVFSHSLFYSLSASKSIQIFCCENYSNNY